MRQTDEKAMMGRFFSKNSPYIEIYFYNIIKLWGKMLMLAEHLETA